MATHKTRRIPKLKFQKLRDIGWHVSYRDRTTGVPRRHRFGIAEREREAEARVLYHAWVLEHLGGQNPKAFPTKLTPPLKQKLNPDVLTGSLLEIASGLIDSERLRAREGDGPKRRGTIDRRVFHDRQQQIRSFLAFMNERRGQGAVARLRIADLTLDDVENYNRAIVDKGYSASQVTKRLQLVKAIIDRAGRPEHGGQVLGWNWDSRDVSHGAPTKERPFPTVSQLRRLISAADLRGRTMIWLGLGLGFGARDIAAIRVGQIAAESYDLRRSKTGVERFGVTPPIVWAYVSKYQVTEASRDGQRLFTTRNGMPLVHGTTNAVTLWWEKLRSRVARKGEDLPSFYTLRHVGATEFGSRPGASIGDVKRWLGHAASSHVADLYMRPVRPEHAKLVQWLRKRLLSTRYRPKPRKRP